ncbi:hypothetical protein SAMN05428938_6866 [Streptomyces sp. KS_5]|nr:hypothetical protein SAMN05428938_6866 [Streptomyces sp. KS_5]
MATQAPDTLVVAVAGRQAAPTPAARVQGTATMAVPVTEAAVAAIAISVPAVATPPRTRPISVPAVATPPRTRPISVTTTAASPTAARTWARLNPVTRAAAKSVRRSETAITAMFRKQPSQPC